MLNKILKRLNGHAEDEPSLGEELAQLGRDRESTEAEIAELNSRRRQLLLDDGSDSELDKLERRIDRAKVRLEKIEIAEGPLRRQLEVAREKARAKAYADAEAALLKEYRDAFNFYVGRLEALADAHRDQTEIRQRARAVLGESRASTLFPAFVYGGFLTDEHISSWVARNREMIDLATGAASRPPGRPPDGIGIRWYTGQPDGSHYDPTKPPGPPKPTLQHAVVMEPMGSRDLAMGVPSLTAPRLPNDEKPLGPGEVRATVLRHGYNPPDGSSCHVGRRIRLPRDLALVAARNGAIEIIEDPARKAAEQASERTFHPVDSLSETHADPTVVMGRSS